MIDFGLTAVHPGHRLGPLLHHAPKRLRLPRFFCFGCSRNRLGSAPGVHLLPRSREAARATAVVAFFVVLLFYPGPIRDMQETLRRLTDLRADNKGLKTRVEEAETRAKAAEARIEVHKAFGRGASIAAATFTAPDDLGRGASLHLGLGALAAAP